MRDWTCVSLVMLVACGNSGDSDDTDAGGDDAAQAIVLTVAADYGSAALATVDLDSRAVSDTLAAVSTDPAVVVREGRVYQVNRYGFDSIRVYTPGQWSSPATEFSVGTGANPQDVEVCGGKVFVSLYGEDFIGVYGLDGETTGSSVSLADYADDDAIPEASSMVVAGDRLYVALNRLNQNNGWVPAGAGKVVAIDCASALVVQAFDTGPNPSIHAFAGAADKLLVRSGIYYNADYTPAFDGGVAVLDVATGVSTPLISEADLQENITDLVVTEEGAMLLSENASAQYSVQCFDVESGEVTLVEQSGSFFIDIEANDRGEAWVAARPNWADASAGSGVAIYDVGDCAALTDGNWLATTLPPYAIAFY